MALHLPHFIPKDVYKKQQTEFRMIRSRAILHDFYVDDSLGAAADNNSA